MGGDTPRGGIWALAGVSNAFILYSIPESGVVRLWVAWSLLGHGGQTASFSVKEFP